MDRDALRSMLQELVRGGHSVDEVLEQLATMPLQQKAATTVDTHRQLRCGFPEVIYGGGKTPAQVAEAFAELAAVHDRALATRTSRAHFEAVRAVLPAAEHREPGGCILWRKRPAPEPVARVAVVTAGTSDLPVAEEAACTLELMDVEADRFHDVGVAGIHRLLPHVPRIRSARAIVVCAGMEGALPSVIGGLVAVPVIAVPTSVGYGASFGGLTALLAMLNSCAAGVGVVNVDNGFGAGYLAGLVALSGARGADPAAKGERNDEVATSTLDGP